MTIHHALNRAVFPALTMLLLTFSGTLLRAQTLIEEPLGDTSEPKMSLFILDLAPGRTARSHPHQGIVFAYVLEGEIENQIEPEPLQHYHAGDFFHERAMQVHSVFRNPSKTEAAKVLIFQNTATLPNGVKPLLQEPLPNLTNQEVSLSKITTAPGGASAREHQHAGPVFAYLLKGEVESQVDPDPPKVYHAGDVFYEMPMHAHRSYRNLSKTEPAELLIFQVREKGKPPALAVEK